MRSTGRDVRDALIGLVPTAVALLVAAWLLDGLTITWWAAILVAAVTGAVDALVRPLLRRIADRTGAARWSPSP